MIPADESSLSEIQGLIKKYKIRPKHSFGQNFLIDDAVYKKIYSAADINADECIIEIGTGWGTLTRLLADRAKSVVTVESDVEMFKAVQQELAPKKNITVLHGNALAFSASELLAKSRAQCTQGKIVANIPYYLTGKLLRTFLSDRYVTKMVLLVQKEVADRILAKPGEMSMISLTAQWYASIENVSAVDRTCFYPVPKVDSRIVMFTPHDIWRNRLSSRLTEEHVFRLARMAFHLRRKKIVNSLSAGLHASADETAKLLKMAHIDPHARPQELFIDQWIALAEQL